jgi:hypothetical protein
MLISIVSTKIYRQKIRALQALLFRRCDVNGKEYKGTAMSLKDA